MLRNETLRLYSPNNIPRHGEANQRVQDGYSEQWSGGGTLKELTTRQSTVETGAGQTRMATARSRAIPRDLNVIADSWMLRQESGTWWTIVNQTRTGDLVTMSLTEAEKPDVDHG